MYPLAQAHHILVLPTAFLALINEKCDDLSDAGAVDEADVDGEEETQDYTD